MPIKGGITIIIFANDKKEIKKTFLDCVEKKPNITQYIFFYDEGLKHSIFIENQIEKMAFKYIKTIKFDNAENAIEDIINECEIENLYCIPCAVAGLEIKIER
ncbi:MAG: hypothetical protein ACI4VW_06365 [Acutalibacteraceae bacterium]